MALLRMFVYIISLLINHEFIISKPISCLYLSLAEL